jgi:hypothetical protein
VIHLEQTISVLGQPMNSGVADAGDGIAQVLNRTDISTALLRGIFDRYLAKDLEKIVQFRRLGAYPAKSHKLW